MLNDKNIFWAAPVVVLTLLIIPSYAEILAEKPEIVAREQWGADPANTELMKKQTPKEIVIHHTAVRQQPNVSLQKKMQGLQQFSMSPGKVGKNNKPAWGDAPYHFYIDAAGAIGEGRDVVFAGDTNTKYDTQDKIQIVLEGQFDKETPSDGQLKALSRLVLWLSANYKIDATSISGHNDFAATDCPGKNLKPYLQTLREGINKEAGSKVSN